MSKQNSFLSKIDIINDDMNDIENTEYKNIDSEIKYNDVDTIKQDGTKMVLFAENALKLINNSMKDMKLAKTMVTKMIRVYQKEVKSSLKEPKLTKRKDTGVMEEKKVPEKILKYLNLPPGATSVRNQIVKKFYSKFKEEGLCYDKDKRILRANDEVMELFDLPQSVNDSTDVKDKIGGFNLYNLPTYVASIYKEEALKNEKKQKKQEAKDKKKQKVKDKKDKKDKKKIKKPKILVIE